MSSISVLMSVYKSEKPTFLSSALKSVWSDQILKPDEIILIKDGPLGKVLDDVIDLWQNEIGSHLKVLVNEQNLGLTKSLNKGIKAASGDYIARMDSDDISLPERFKLQYEYMESHSEVTCLGGGMQEIDENDKNGAIRIYPTENENIKKYIVKANPFAHPTTFMRRSIFLEGFLYDERYRKNQDLKLWFDLLRNGYILHNIPDIVLKFRRTSETYEKRSSKISLKSEIEIYDNGICSLYGKTSFKRIFPYIRYFIKSMSPSVNRFVYAYLFKKKNQ